MPLHFCVRACTPIKTPSDEHDTGDGEKEQAAQRCFHLYPLLTAWKTQSPDTWKMLTPVCVSVCVWDCSILHVADHCRSYLSACIWVFNEEAVVGRVCLVCVNALRQLEAALVMWQNMTCCVCLSFECVVIVFAAHPLTDSFVYISCWVMSQCCLGVCCCTLMETDRKLEMLNSRIWNMLMNQHNNNPLSHMQ